MTPRAHPAGRDHRRSLLRAVALFGVSVLVAWLLLSQRHELRINLAFASTPTGPGEIFHAGSGEDFNAGQSTSFPTTSDGTLQMYRVDISPRKPIERVRLDLATAPGPIELASLEVRRKILFLKTARREVALEPVTYHHMGPPERRDGGGLGFESFGNDPHLEIALPAATMAALDDAARALQLAVAILCGLVAVGIGALLQVARGAARRSPRTRPRLDRELMWLTPVARGLSDPAVIRFSTAGVAVLLLSLLLAAGGIGARLNLSSVGMWDVYLPSTTTQNSSIIGQPRSIRGDEWLVHTPWMLNQAAKDFPVSNAAVGGLHSTLLTSVPVRHPMSVAQPEFWGFAFLDLERAISWYWMYKVFGLLTSAFLLLLLLTRNDVFASVLGAAWLGLSSYTQWWFSTNLPEMLTGLFMTLVGFIYVCRSSRHGALAFGVVSLVCGAATFAFQIYPAFQIPLAYLAGVIVLGVFATRAERAHFIPHARIRIALLAVATATLAFLLYRFAVDADQTIHAMSGTVYPGKRFSTGGDMPWWMTFDGLFEVWRTDESRYPWPGLNASEASDYVLLFPLLLAAALLPARRALREPLILLLFGFCVLVAAWMAIPLPPATTTALSKFTLFSFVPSTRATLALGVASILLVTVFASRVRRLTLPVAGLRDPIFVAATILVAYWYGATLQRMDAFFTMSQTLLGCLVAALGAWAVARGNRFALGALVAALAVPGLMVNPVGIGLDPLLKKPALQAAVAASGAGASTRWMMVGSYVFAQAFKANGLDIVGGTTYVPDPHLTGTLDPNGYQSEVWNRYAHVQFESAPSLPAPAFSLLHTDHYLVRLDICSEYLDALGVNRVAYAGVPPTEDLQCLSQVGTTIDGLSLYVRTPR